MWHVHSDLHRQRLGLQAEALAGLAGRFDMYLLISSRDHSLSVSRSAAPDCVITPSNGLFGLIGAQAVVIGK